LVREYAGSRTLVGQVCSCHAIHAQRRAPPSHSPGRATGSRTGRPTRRGKAGLRRRGDLTFWVEEAALAGWQAPRRSTPGGQPRYSELAIELVLTLRLVFHLALRQAEEFARSVLALLGMAPPVPDHAT